MSRLEEARGDLSRLIQLEPSNREAREMLVKAKERLKELGKLQAAYEEEVKRRKEAGEDEISFEEPTSNYRGARKMSVSECVGFFVAGPALRDLERCFDELKTLVPAKLMPLDELRTLHVLICFVDFAKKAKEKQEELEKKQKEEAQKRREEEQQKEEERRHGDLLRHLAWAASAQFSQALDTASLMSRKLSFRMAKIATVVKMDEAELDEEAAQLAAFQFATGTSAWLLWLLLAQSWLKTSSLVS
eukprot:Skav215234  [mRNA]  locus=scaffold341:343005:354511:- [translate_table: standard]